MKRRWALLFAGLALTVALGACGSAAKNSASTDKDATTSTTAGSATQGTKSTTTSTTEKVALTGPTASEIDGSKTVEVGGKTVKVPTDGGKPINSQVDDGQQIVISASGFLPSRLYSNPGKAIVWTNLTDQPQQIIFDAFPVKSTVIAPGAVWSWKTQDSESIAYHSNTGLSAVVAVLPPGL
jgi:hypothetical protein